MRPERRAEPAEKEGEQRHRVSLPSTTVSTGGGQVVPEEARREKRGVVANVPGTHIFTRRRLLTRLPGRRIMMAAGNRTRGGGLDEVRERNGAGTILPGNGTTRERRWDG